MTKLLRGHLLSAPAQATQPVLPAAVESGSKAKNEVVDPDGPGGQDAPVPKQFEYYSDGLDDYT
jgi:hypothetical protein